MEGAGFELSTLGVGFLGTGSAGSGMITGAFCSSGVSVAGMVVLSVDSGAGFSDGAITAGFCAGGVTLSGGGSG